MLTLKKVRSYLKTFFTVNFSDELKFGDTKCGEGKYSVGKKYVKNVDFYLKVTLDNQQDYQNPASALNCLVEKNTGRPVLGLFFINLAVTPVLPY